MESQINFIRKQMKNIDLECELDKYSILKKRLEELVIQQATLATRRGVEVYAEAIKKLGKMGR